MSEKSEKDNSENNKKDSLGQKITYFFKGIRPLILSHHPNCEHFYDHTFEFRGKRFCYGCYIGWPVAIITLVILLIIQIQQYIYLGTLFQIGFFLCCAYLLSIFKLTKFKIIKIASKIIIGIGLGTMFASIILTEYPLWFKLLIIVILMNITTFVVNLKRGYEIDKICKACSYQDDWENCPGMKESMQYFIKSGVFKSRSKSHSKNIPKKTDSEPLNND